MNFKIQQGLTTLLLLSATGLLHAKNSINVSDRELLGGGHEIIMKGEPQVVHKISDGLIKSGMMQTLLFTDNTQRSHYSGGVSLEFDDINLMLISEKMTEIQTQKNTRYIFPDLVTIGTMDLLKAAGGTSYSCSGGIAYKNGESTGETRVTHHNVVEISCDMNDNVVVERI